MDHLDKHAALIERLDTFPVQIAPCQFDAIRWTGSGWTRPELIDRPPYVVPKSVEVSTLHRWAVETARANGAWFRGITNEHRFLFCWIAAKRNKDPGGPPEPLKQFSDKEQPHHGTMRRQANG